MIVEIITFGVNATSAERAHNPPNQRQTDSNKLSLSQEKQVDCPDICSISTDTFWQISIHLQSQGMKNRNLLTASVTTNAASF